MTVIVGYNRGANRHASSSGHAQYGSHYAYVNVPSGKVDPVDFAHVIAHEFGHCKGLRHGHMPPHMGDSTGHRTDYIRNHFAWAKDLQIRKVELKAKLTDTVSDKLAHAIRMRERAITRLKRAQTIERKWRAKVQYYTRKTGATPIAACQTDSKKALDLLLGAALKEVQS